MPGGATHLHQHSLLCCLILVRVILEKVLVIWGFLHSGLPASWVSGWGCGPKAACIGSQHGASFWSITYT